MIVPRKSFILAAAICVLTAGAILWGAASPYTLLERIRKNQPADSLEKPSDKLLAVLWKYSPDACILVQRTETMLGDIKIGGSRVIWGESDARSIITGSDGKKTVVILTNRGYRKYIDNSDSFHEQVKDLETAVHELCHSYTSRYAMKQFSLVNLGMDELMVESEARPGVHSMVSFDTYYRGRGRQFITVTRATNSGYDTAIPGIRTISDRVPEANRTFRYNTYISRTASHKAVSMGLYGLLDEYNAYCWSLRVKYDLYDYYKDERPQTPASWIEWLSGSASFLFSWAEFRYWTLFYLDNTKKNYPGIYKALLADKPLREAFTAIDDDYTALAGLFITRIFKELPVHLSSQGMKADFGPSAPFSKDIKGLDFKYSIDHYSTTLMSYNLTPHLEAMKDKNLIILASEFRLSPAPELPELPGTNRTQNSTKVKEEKKPSVKKKWKWF